ncbi:MAG: hypothetical protein KC588_04065 [Nitrospira sp.]|nr:hypothetical protein [Nitrospira sp.]
MNDLDALIRDCRLADITRNSQYESNPATHQVGEMKSEEAPFAEARLTSQRRENGRMKIKKGKDQERGRKPFVSDKIGKPVREIIREGEAEGTFFPSPSSFTAP